MSEFEQKVAALRKHHEELLSRKNEPVEWGNGIYGWLNNSLFVCAPSFASGFQGIVLNVWRVK